MTNFLKNIFKKPETKSEPVKEQHSVQPEKFDFVEEYTLFDPKRVMTNYDVFMFCNSIPVAYEENHNQHGGFANCVMLETKLFLPFLQGLSNAPQEISQKPEMRTISIINLSNTLKMYVIPNINQPDSVFISVRDKGQDAKSGWSLHVTPQINRAIAQQIKKSRIR